MPLAGKRILVTRSRDQASELAARLVALGAEAVLVPTIELAPLVSYGALDAALANLGSFDWLLFTSANAVQAFDRRAKQLHLTPSPKRVAAIGPATANAVRGIGLAVDLVPMRFVAESMVEALLPHARGASMLLVRAEVARDLLPEALTAAGALLTVVPAYRTVVPAGSMRALQQLFAGVRTYPDAVTLTSASTVHNLLALLDAADLVLPENILRASIGPITSQALREAGYPPHVEAEQATLASLCAALERV